MAGMQHFDLSKNECIRKDRLYGRDLNHETLLSSVKEFLNYEQPASRIVIQKFLLKLRNVLEFIEGQREFAFYSSSVLIAYDAAQLSRCINEPNAVCNGGGNDSDDSWVRVFMIDFAHVFPLNPEASRDENYLFGLTNIIRLFEGIS